MTLSTTLLADHLAAELAREDGPAGPGSGLPLNRRLAEALRRAIQDGRLGAGDRLPSSRELAADLRLSRNTVVAALEQLAAEGWVRGRVGSGTFVAEPPAGLGAMPRRGAPAAALPGLSRRGQRLARTRNAQHLEVQPFTPGAADFSAFPVALWQRLQNRHWRGARPEMLDYTTSGGYGPLRRAVADHLRVARGMRLQPEQVIITSGTQQSLELCARLLADEGDIVWIEDPAYWGAAKALQACGLRLHALPVDAQGWAPPPAPAPAPRLIYVTPSHQYPTGAVMPLARRRALLAEAARHQAWVLEDDYDSEFRFDGAPIAALAGLDDDGRVCYLGTFSKVLYPGLKLGYLVVPRALVEDFRQAHYDLNRPGQLPLQAALAEFIELGHFASALRRARQAYAARRAQLLQALQPLRALPGVALQGAAQGLHLCLQLPGQADDAAIAQQLAAEGITVRPLSAYCLARDDLRGLLIGYGYAQPGLIEPCARRLVEVVRQALQQPA
ncbi:HTH-type transcriptional regulatory protein GabR [Tepidimonas sediminis]|uniref:HTH-type transcriptional regulatory protein GabR n=1 Tax=Tepidimonas sediminis TaxID=2588941 RepID=A0A554WQJ8_9BURK|nr:PLP-dependent aminotransferase family protein [Tepidimonas sediminis]TSE25859.1 HTH-type transcriptional regulatory protein GabR [Tepidimonas sediminis]